MWIEFAPLPCFSLPSRIRDLVDSILLGALDANHTSLVLQFSHLAVGGAYLPPTSHAQLLVVVHGDGGGVEIGDGGGGGDDEGDVEVEVEGGSGDTSVQVCRQHPHCKL